MENNFKNMNGIPIELIFDKSTKIESIFLCEICNNILLNGKSCIGCEDCYCEECLEKTLKKDKENNALCKNCKSIDFRGIPIFLNKKLSNLTFKCCYNSNGCKEIIPYNDYYNHKNTCNYKPISCEYNGCNVSLLLENYEEHKINCDYKPITCDHCKKQFIKKDIEIHDSECELKIINCNGCKISVMRKDLKEHIDNCEFAMVNCPLCKVEYYKKDLINHKKIDCLNNYKQAYYKEYTQKLKILTDRLYKLKVNFEIIKNFVNIFFCFICKRYSCDFDLLYCKLCDNKLCKRCCDSNTNNCYNCDKIYCRNCLKEKNKLCIDCVK